MTTTHVHRWTTKSRHRTSEGTVVYDGCTCGRLRIRRATTLRAEETLAVTPVRTGGLHAPHP
ncbi:hypothetical protein [Jiangella anatolica]|nr:hypothetical protein [Jiangella anatolica]